jgi:purine-binding chemotaxis protein CheW
VEADGNATPAHRREIDWEVVRSRLEDSQAAFARALGAEELARRGHEDAGKAAPLAALVFLLGRERYALPLPELAEVLPFEACTSIPEAPAEVLGVINLRGEIRLVLDLRHILGLAPEDADGADAGRGYVLLLRRVDQQVGLRVEQVQQIRLIPAGDIRPPAESGLELTSRYLRGHTPDMVLVLDVEAILTHAPVLGAVQVT